MRKSVLAITVLTMMFAQSSTAQTRVKNLYTESPSFKVEQVENTAQTVQVNRYFFAGYNTLCLPMSMNASQLDKVCKGLRVERLETIRQERQTLCLYFVDCTSEGIEAGVPYLVYSPRTQYLRVKNTEVDGVNTELKTIRMADSEGNQVAFSSSWEIKNKDGLYGIPAKQNVTPLESVLVRTTTDQSFLPTRCGISWEHQSQSANDIEIRHISASDATAIRSIQTTNRNTNGMVFDLNGRRVNDNQRGLYIKNGKKVVK